MHLHIVELNSICQLITVRYKMQISWETQRGTFFWVGSKLRYKKLQVVASPNYRTEYSCWVPYFYGFFSYPPRGIVSRLSSRRLRLVCQGSKAASKQASRPASKQAKKGASEQASKPASERASKQASKPTKQASKQGSKQGSQRANNLSSRNFCPNRPRL